MADSEKQLNEALQRIAAAMEALIERMGPAPTALSTGNSVKPAQPSKPAVELVRDVLASTNNRGLAANDIASLAGLSPGSVRSVLYGNKEEFKPSYLSPKRVIWRLHHDRFSSRSWQPSSAHSCELVSC